MNTPRSKTALGLLLCAAALALGTGCERTAPAQAGTAAAQPVQFNHRLHVVDMDLDCPTCHQYVLRERKATLPTRDVCLECHEEQQGESAEEAKLVNLLSSGEELNWQRVYVLPEHVYFSHRRHVTLGQIGCQDCHGDMRELTAPPTRPAVNIIDMDHCMECHEERQARTDCLDCHN